VPLLTFHGLVFFGSKIHRAKKHEIDLKCQTRARADEVRRNRALTPIYILLQFRVISGRL